MINSPERKFRMKLRFSVEGGNHLGKGIHHQLLMAVALARLPANSPQRGNVNNCVTHVNDASPVPATYAGDLTDRG
jgi:hypothetical protein